MRVLVLVCGAGLRRAGAAAQAASQRLLVDMKMALIEGGMTLSSLSMDAFQASFDNFGTGDDHAAAIADDELLDPDYVSDLEAMAISEVKANLVKFAAPLEAYVRERELKSAQIESLLNEAYLTHATAKPRMAPPRPLADYPLQNMPPAPPMSPAPSSPLHDAALPRGERVAALAKGAWGRVMTRCNAEAQARMARKNLQIIDRVTAIDKQRYALVAWLRDSDAGAASPKTEAFQATFAANAAADGGPVAGVLLHSTPCVYRNRPGSFFVAFGHIAFHSRILGFQVMRVVALMHVRACRKGAAALGLAPSIIIDVAQPATAAAAPSAEGAAESTESVSFHFPVDRDQLYELIDQVLAMNRGAAQSRNPLAGLNMPPPPSPPAAPKVEIELLDSDLGKKRSLASVLAGGLSGLWGGQKQSVASAADDEEEEVFATQEPGGAGKPPVAVADLLEDFDFGGEGGDSGAEDEL
jgi:hypothetical protein